MNTSNKPVPQVALEVMMKRNREEADHLLKRSQELLADNKKIEHEMAVILASVPASSRVSPRVVVHDTMPVSSKPDPAGGLFHAADALVRSWKRRKKKNFKQLELDLMTALERMNG
jgi:hypothetical protein